MAIEKTVFISYRRSTGSVWALAIWQNLTHHGYDVFFDYEGIASGDFEQVILENIKARAHFVVLLTPSALERVDESGDWLRREIETALEHRRNVVPVMLEGFDFALPSIGGRLTGTLATLKSYNGLTVPIEYFDAAMNKLRSRHLNVPVQAVLHPPSNAAKDAATEQRTAAESAPAVRKEELMAEQLLVQGSAAANVENQLRYYSEAIRLNPDYELAYRVRGLTRRLEGDLDGGLADYNEVIRLSPKANNYSTRGGIRYEVGDSDGAVADFSEAIRLQPDEPKHYLYRGIARHRRGDSDGALNDSTEAIRLEPALIGAHLNRGKARCAKGDLDGALDDFTEAIRLTPDEAEAYYRRGEARIMDQDNRFGPGRGDLDAALRDLTEAIRLKPDYTEAYFWRGYARRAQGDFDAALTDLTEVIRLKADFYVAYYIRGLARRAKSDFDGALTDLTDAIRLKPDYIDAYNERGLTFAFKGDLDGALKDHAEAVRLEPDDCAAYFYRAQIRERQSARVAAVADYQKYLDLGGGLRGGNQAWVEEKIRRLQQAW